MVILNIITSNISKAKEIEKILSDNNILSKHISESCSELQSETLDKVIKWKLNFFKKKGHDNFIVDDSGLFISSLNGFPGVFSSYVKKTIGCDGILKLMENEKNKKAKFISKIGFFFNQKSFIFTGSCKGNILPIQKGNDIFGFDSIFSIDNINSFSQYSLEKKNNLSHRGIAINNLIKKLKIIGSVG